MKVDTVREQKILEQIINAEEELHKATDAKWIAEKAIANREAQLDRLHTTLKHIQQEIRLTLKEKNKCI